MNLCTAVMQRSVRVGLLYPGHIVAILPVTYVLDFIIVPGVGWLALLILAKGQCEGLNIGIGAEKKLPRPFFISKYKANINAKFWEL